MRPLPINALFATSIHVSVARMTAFGQAGSAPKIKPAPCDKFTSFYAMV